jgi:hypothetical protein
MRGQCRRRGEREVVRQVMILAFAQSDGRDTHTAEARIEVGECGLDAPEVREVRVHDLADLWMADVGRMTRDEQYVVDACIFKTLEEHALAHHAGGTEDHDLHE